MKLTSLELLAPARDVAIGRAAIRAGADAVYIGAPAFGARAAAKNDISDIALLCDYAHAYNARIYVTMNTILFDSELKEAERMVRQLYGAGADALIVQDMAYLKMDLPPIALHASTQCDIRTPEKARMLAMAGFSQLVLPREFSLTEISAARNAAGVPVEVFVHGALCVSYSGDCQAGCRAMGRSANRGECPQMCRMAYKLEDAGGNPVGPERHYLSLRDLNRLDDLEALINAGASSFKIEGRLKDQRYVTNVVGAYSNLLNKLVKQDHRFRRASAGRSELMFTPDVDRTFNRSYTSYFISRPKPAQTMASLDTPKWAGRPVGKVSSGYESRRGSFRAELTDTLANGDGLGYFDKTGQFVGFRLNRVDGNNLYPAQDLPSLQSGTTLYRNFDKNFFDLLDREDSCRRTISVVVRLSPVDDNRISLAVIDERGYSVEICVDSEAQESRTDQTNRRKEILCKTGDTIFRVERVEDTLGSRFVASSVLTEGRRRLLMALKTAAEARYHYDRRKPCLLPNDAFRGDGPLDYHWNVANRLAREFYEEHGAVIKEMAVEVDPRKDETIVMSTRYCLRRELGACLLTAGGKKLPQPLYLRNRAVRYRLDFDCHRCGMNVVDK